MDSKYEKFLTLCQKRKLACSLNESEYIQIRKAAETNAQCAYCNLSVVEYRQLRKEILEYTGMNRQALVVRNRIFKNEGVKRIKNLTIDRADNSKGYHVENIEFSCWFCNSVKGALISSTDMKTIAKNNLKQLKELFSK